MTDPTPDAISSSNALTESTGLSDTLQAVPSEISPGSYEFVRTKDLREECTILLECQASEFPLEQYCKYVRHPGGETPYTFSNMEFHENPPGIRLGPWPGWRGIPEFPLLQASCGPVRASLPPTFWGDEFATGVLRFSGSIRWKTDGPITITSPDSRIVPRRMKVFRTRRVQARPHPVELLEELHGVHPRLLLTPALLPLIRSRAAGSHLPIWEKVLSLWSNRDLPFAKSAESKCVPGPERLSWEDRVLMSAFIALITERKVDIRRALESYAGYVDETGRPGFEPLGIDTQAGEVLFILSVGFDWLFAWLSESERARAWQRLEQVAHVCGDFLGPERRDYGQAHYLGCGLGLLAFAFLAADRASIVPSRIAELRGALDCALQLLPEDGSYPHGMNLWIYEFGFLLRWVELLRGCAGDDIWVSAGEALRRASHFRAATLSYDARHGITFGDPQYRVGGDSWCHFLIASRTRSGEAEWLGERLQDLPHEGVDFRHVPARRRVYEFLFFDPALHPAEPSTGVHAFRDTGQVIVRSERTLFTFRSGPPLGTRRYNAGEYGAYGHSDPANGSFLLEHEGQFVASGPGPVYKRDTQLHNVVTIDGQGQVGDGTVWLPDFFPPEMLAHRPDIRTDGARASVSVDLANAYLPHLGLRGYRRAIYVDPGRFVFGVDTVSCQSLRRIEWNVHSRFPFLRAQGENPIVFNLGDAVQLALMTTADLEVETGVMEFVPAYPNDGTREYRCVVKSRGAAAQFVWCYLLSPQPLPLLRPGGERGGVTVEFSGGMFLDFDGRMIAMRSGG